MSSGQLDLLVQGACSLCADVCGTSATRSPQAYPVMCPATTSVTPTGRERHCSPNMNDIMHPTLKVVGVQLENVELVCLGRDPGHSSAQQQAVMCLACLGAGDALVAAGAAAAAV